MKAFIILFILASCSHKHGHNHANQHMHQKSHESLIKAFDDPGRNEWQKPELVLDLLGPLKDKHVIDIGSGSGYFTKFFLKAKALTTAADVDKKFLHHIQSALPQDQYPGLQISQINYDDPKMAKESFDLAFTCNTYHHIENRSEYLEKVKNGLKPLGRLVVVDFKKDHLGKKHFGPHLEMRISVDQVVKEVIEAGFQNVIVYYQTLEYQYIVVASK